MGQDVMGCRRLPLIAGRGDGSGFGLGDGNGEFSDLGGVAAHQRQAEQAMAGLSGLATGRRGAMLVGRGIVAQRVAKIGGERSRSVERGRGEAIHQGNGQLQRQGQQQQTHRPQRAAPEGLQSPAPGSYRTHAR